MNPTDRPYVLHGFDVSYFTAKARAALRYKQLYLEEKRANVRWILEQTGHAFIPVVTTPEGEVWQDTSEILDALEARHPDPPLLPRTPVHRIVCALLEVFADEVMLTAAMHTRWGTEEGEALTRRRFGAMTGSLEQGNRAADQMVKGRFAVGATPEAGPAIDEHLTAMLAALSAHFETQDFVLGDRMSVADCALMGPIYAHFYTDLVSRRLLLETALPVVRWIEYCTMPGADDQGDWFADDALPAPLVEVLRTFGRDGAPLLIRLAEVIEAWADEHAVVGETPPRAVGVAVAAARGDPHARCPGLLPLDAAADSRSLPGPLGHRSRPGRFRSRRDRVGARSRLHSEASAREEGLRSRLRRVAPLRQRKRIRSTTRMNALRRLRSALGFVSTFGRAVPSALRYGPDRRIDFSDALAEHFQRRPDQPALISESSRMSWGDLDRFANRVANWAIGRGLSRGDVVALLMENRAEYVAIWLGLSRAGVVTALLNTNLTGDRLAHCMREARTAHLIVGSELAEGAASALTELDTKPEILLASFDSEADAKAATLLESTSFDAACEAAGEAAVPDSVRSARRGGDGLFYIYTSGTTGLPKAARVSHSKALTAGTGCWKFQGLTPADRLYCCLPLYHSAGGMLATAGILLAGGTLVTARKFSASRFWSDCVQHDITVFQYIGELCRYMLNSPTHPDENRHRIRTAMGNGLRPEVWGPFVDRFKIPRIVEFYGATEGNMMLLNHEGRIGAVGYLPSLLQKAQGIRIARFDVVEESVIRGADGFCVPADFDEPGELLIKINATQRFEGYTNEEASKKKILTDVFESGDAYFRTGDLLRVDRDDYFYFVDRIGDTFRWKERTCRRTRSPRFFRSSRGWKRRTCTVSRCLARTVGPGWPRS